MLRCPVAAWEGWEGWTTKRDLHEDFERAAAGNCRAVPILFGNRALQSSAVANQSLATHVKAGASKGNFTLHSWRVP
jgi:hypothetical protein